MRGTQGQKMQSLETHLRVLQAHVLRVWRFPLLCKAQPSCLPQVQARSHQGGSPGAKITWFHCPSNSSSCLQAGSSCGPKHRVCIIDEIGKMELFSQPFIQAVRQTLSTPGIIVVGTIPVPKGKPLALVEEIRKRRDVKVFNVSKPSGELASLGSHLSPCVFLSCLLQAVE